MNDIEIATENINDEDDIIEDFEDWYYTVWDETDANNIFNKFVYWSLNICHVSFFFLILFCIQKSAESLIQNIFTNIV